jgi:hypothetical protein
MIETDMVTHACMAVPANIFWLVGGENEKLVRGTDPDLRFRIRRAGFKVIGRKGILVYHPLPSGLCELIKKSFLSGRDAALSFRLFPDLIYDLSDRPLFRQSQVTNKGLIFRTIRAILRLLQDMVELKPLLFVHHIFYLLGYPCGMFIHKDG